MSLATITLLVKIIVLGTALLMSYFTAQDVRHYGITWRYMRNSFCSTAFFWCVNGLVYYGA
jgi:hypothetical protein